MVTKFEHVHSGTFFKRAFALLSMPTSARSPPLSVIHGPLDLWIISASPYCAPQQADYYDRGRPQRQAWKEGPGEVQVSTQGVFEAFLASPNQSLRLPVSSAQADVLPSLCSEDDTIGDLKKLVAAQTGTRPEKIRIQKWYNVYKDHITLADYEVHDGMGLELYYN